MVDLGALELMAVHTLALTIGGTGQGSVTIAPPPTGCSVSCSNSYPSDTPLTLHATPDQYSLFDGWSGNGCSGTADCLLALVTDTTVAAGFTLDIAHAVLGSSGTDDYYVSLQQAYDGALAGGTIKSWGIEFDENLTCGTTKAVTLKGGWNGTYTAISGLTVLHGKLTVQKGTLTVGNLVIK